MVNSVVLEMRNITKKFPGVVANNDVTFKLNRGEVHALLGENGAGKTTLMNILYGLYQQDSGKIILNGKEVEISSPKIAISNGIGMVHQHFMLVPTLTVVENVILGMESSPFKLEINNARNKILELCRKYNFQVDVDRKVSELSVGAQQRVELIKALYRGADILIMDEPTAVLTPLEVEELFITLRQLVATGKSVVFISHKLWEVMKISDRVTILKGGEYVSTCNTCDTTKEELASKMVGREIVTEYIKEPVKKIGSSIKLENVCVKGDSGASSLKNISFDLNRGEILGIAGVDGNGQKELAETIMGLRTVESGTICFDGGKDITSWGTKERINAGIAHVPEDRLKQGLVLDFTVSENLILNTFDRPPFTLKGIFRPATVEKNGENLVDEFDVRPQQSRAKARNFSGGNQQKIVLARELSRNPKFILAVQPTRGLDVGASEFVYQRLLQEKNKGGSVLLISADLDEILLVSDRVLVMYEGKIMGEFIPGEVSYIDIGLMMGGTPYERKEIRI